MPRQDVPLLSREQLVPALALVYAAGIADALKIPFATPDPESAALVAAARSAHQDADEPEPPTPDPEAALIGQIVAQVAVRNVVVAFWAALEPDERYDPADDPRESEALAQLARVLGDETAARGVAEALYLLRTPPDAGTGEGPELPLTPAA